MMGAASGIRRGGIGFVFVACLVWAWTAAAVADPVGPTSADRYVTRTCVKLLGDRHLLRHPLDDEISKRGFDSFLKMLDPMKVYFHQSDVDGFAPYADQLDDMAQQGDVSFAYRVFQVFLKRVDERLALVDEFLAAKHDFTVDEEMVADPDAAQYPKTPKEARERWRMRIKYDLLVLKADDITGEAAITKLSKRYHSFSKRMHQTDAEDLLEMYLSSLTSAFDPHTAYMSPQTYEDFQIAMRLNLDGIGASLMSEDGTTVIKRVLPGGAADKDGRLKVDDKIVGVGDGRDGEIVDVVDMKLRDVVKLIRGKPGTIVRLEVIPADGSKRKIVDIARATIALTDNEATSEIFEVGQKPDGKPFKIGVIDLPSFYMDMEAFSRRLPDYKSTTRDVRRILDEFNAKGVDAVVLDLRLNGGGSLTEAIDLTGLFIDQGPVVQVKGPDGEVVPYPDEDEGVAWAGPLVVLTSKFSASASEILAGAIQDYGRGLIVGDRATHGKGTVQSLQNLTAAVRLFQIPNAPQLGALKVTIQQFYRPSGESTQNRGVLADLEWPSLTTHLDVGESDLDHPIAFDRIEPAPFRPLGYVSRPVRERLRELSAQRCQQSEDFQKVVNDIQLYKKHKERKYVTLNEEKFLAERAQLNAEKEREKKFEQMADPNHKAIERDFYLDEALAIALDYVQLMDHLARAN
ncbi:MAG: carboxy terminal-processing peptidase [Pirellulales bacterium]|nr:carboxy terminal-processing peptidase [Pirellulales bacterium]